MTNSNKDKGDRAERAVREWYRENGYVNAERTRAGYQRDTGDVHVTKYAMAQVKNVRTPRWTEWLMKLAHQQYAGKFDFAWLVVKRHRIADPGEWLAVMTVAEHAELLARAERWRSTP